MAYWSKKRTMEIWDAYNDKREKIGQYLVRGERYRLAYIISV